MSDLSSYLEVCERAIRAGADVLREKLGNVTPASKGVADLVTEADYQAQAAVFAVIHSNFPTHAFMGEESPAGPAANEAGDNGPLGADSDGPYRWIVDPLDGTTNFVHNVPFFSVSLALEKDGQLLVGGVYDPMLDECFLAAAGKGATLNGRPIHTSDVRQLGDALAALGLPPVALPDSPDLRLLCAAASRCQALRRTGSAALNLAYTAAGRFDASWALSTKVWDIAAGVLLIREAGGVVVSPSGAEIDINQGGYLATATPELMEQLRSMARQAMS